MCVMEEVSSMMKNQFLCLFQKAAEVEASFPSFQVSKASYF